MEFKAIIDAKARHEAGCAVVGVYEDGDLGIAARRIDAQLNGTIGKLRGDGDFSAKLGEALLLPAPAGAAAARVLLIGLGNRSGYGRKQYRKALQSAVQSLAPVLASDWTADCRALRYCLRPYPERFPKQYRKALQSAVQSLAKTGASDAVVYLA